MKKALILLLALLTLGTAGISAQIDAKELAKWEGRKYSMFIHWGIYSQLGGVWQDKKISYGLSEQIQSHAGIYSDVYAEVAESFNPVKWNADSVVLLAKNAGMKSIVFTSKHHDGFCMYGTKTTKFNIVDATPYKRDVLKELSEACARHGVKFALYYSLIDWNFPQAAPISSHNSDIITPEHFEFNKAQVKELLTNYGEVAELWFDMGSHSLEQSIEMKKWVRKFQPNCMVGGRIGNGQGDFMVMGDNQEPSYIIGVPWQSPASFFDVTWGYRSWQERGSEDAKYKEKLTSLINVCGRGGNFLLNIGPRGDGSVVEFESNILHRIGEWLKINGEAIYNTQPDPFHMAFDWGAVTSTSDAIYLHILNAPENGKILLPGLTGNISRISLLGAKSKFKSVNTKQGVEIALPANMNRDDVNVIKIAFRKGYEVAPLNVVELNENTKLNQLNAFNYYSHCGVDYNSMYQSTIKNVWTLHPAKSEKVTPQFTFSEQELGKTLELQLGDKTIDVKLCKKTAKPETMKSQGITWGDIYEQDMRRSSLMTIAGDLKDISLNKNWGKKPWKRSQYENNKDYTFKGGLMRAYYLLQTITSPDAQTVAVAITSGDGVVTALNGDVLINHGNLKKTEKVKDIVHLPLKKGENTLLIKVFANFHDEVPFRLGTNIDQKLYTIDLDEVELKAEKYFPISWKVKDQISVHETMNMPNLSLRFK